MRKRGLSFLMLAGVVLVAMAFMTIKTGNIQGKVSPVDGALDVLAIVGTDTLNTTVSNGNFAFRNVKTGTYTVVIRANAPYKDQSVKNVAVIDSTTTDLGLIKLLQ